MEKEGETGEIRRKRSEIREESIMKEVGERYEKAGEKGERRRNNEGKKRSRIRTVTATTRDIVIITLSTFRGFFTEKFTVQQL